MSAERTPDGKIIAPATFVKDSDDGGQAWAEGQVTLSPGDPGYDTWDEWLKLSEGES